jgi:hypothetical protein
MTGQRKTPNFQLPRPIKRPNPKARASEARERCWEGLECRTLNWVRTELFGTNDVRSAEVWRRAAATLPMRTAWSSLREQSERAHANGARQRPERSELRRASVAAAAKWGAGVPAGTNDASPASERVAVRGRVGGSGGAKPPTMPINPAWGSPREQSERAHANGAGHGAPASERVGGSGGAKPPGKK